MLLLHNMIMEPLNVRKEKGATECDKSTVICDVDTAECEDRTVKCEKRKWNYQM